MNHPNTPVYYTISSVCQYDGNTTVLAICEDMDAVSYRLKQCYTTCGDEYIINAYHLTTASDAAVKYNEHVVSQAKYKRDREETEAKLKELEEIKTMSFDDFEKKEQEDFDKMMDYDPETDAASYT